MAEIAANKNSLSPLKFHLFSLKFTPFKAHENDYDSKGILNSIFKFLDEERLAHRAFVVDRNRNKEDEESRQLFLVGSSRDLKAKCFKCSIALLKTGRPLLVKSKDAFSVKPYDESMGSIAEQTHFFVDYSTENCIVCVEFNSGGPRFSDIDHYLLTVAKEKLGIAKASDYLCFMNQPIDKTLAELKDVMSIELKVKPAKIAQLDPIVQSEYFSAINTLGNKIRPSFIRLEANFSSPGKSILSKQVTNTGANTMATRLITMFKEKPQNIDAFDDFVVKYKTKDGADGIFNLLSGKREFLKLVDWSELKNTRHWYELIKEDFDSFIATL